MKKLRLSKATLFGSIFTAISVSAIVGAVAYSRIDSSGDYANSYLGSRQELRDYVNTDRAPARTKYSWDASSAGGPYPTTNGIRNTENTTGLPLIRTSSTEKNEYDEKGNLKTRAKLKFKLEGANALIVNYGIKQADGSIKSENVVYDNDTTNEESSEWTTSVNNPSLVSILLSKKGEVGFNIYFSIRQGVKWIDQKGNKTKYDLVPEDYFYSLKRTYLTNAIERRANGGSAALDNAELNGAGTIFRSNGGFSNDYLFKFFGIKINNSMTQEEFVVDSEDIFGNKNVVPGKISPKLFKIGYESDVESIYEGFVKTVAEVAIWCAAPSQYIEDKLQSEEVADAGFGEARKYGIYSYGRELESTYFVGNYYYSDHTTLKIIFSKNNHYWDQEWVNSKSTINKLETIYSRIDLSILPTVSFNRFKQGETYQASFLQRSTSERTEILANSKRYGLGFSSNNLALSSTQDFFWNIAPSGLKIAVQKNDKTPSLWGENDFFNEQAYGLFYGLKAPSPEENLNKTIGEYLEGEDLSTAISSYSIGKGAAFRSSLLAAVNWYSLTRIYLSTQTVPWLSAFPPSIKLSEKLEVEDIASKYDNEINNFATWNDDYGKAERPSKEKDLEIFKRYADIETISRSSVYESAKRNVSSMINEYIEKGIIDKDKPIKISIPRRFINPNQRDTIFEDKIVEVMNSLDKRLQITRFQPKDANGLRYSVSVGEFSSTSGRNSAFNFFGWNADYNGSSSFFAGFIKYGYGLASLASVYENYRNNMNDISKSQFKDTQILQLAIALNEKLKEIYDFRIGPSPDSPKDPSPILIFKKVSLTDYSNYLIGSGNLDELFSDLFYKGKIYPSKGFKFGYKSTVSLFSALHEAAGQSGIILPSFSNEFKTIPVNIATSGLFSVSPEELDVSKVTGATRQITVSGTKAGESKTFELKYGVKEYNVKEWQEQNNGVLISQPDGGSVGGKFGSYVFSNKSSFDSFTKKIVELNVEKNNLGFDWIIDQFSSFGVAENKFKPAQKKKIVLDAEKPKPKVLVDKNDGSLTIEQFSIIEDGIRKYSFAPIKITNNVRSEVENKVFQYVNFLRSEVNKYSYKKDFISEIAKITGTPIEVISKLQKLLAVKSVKMTISGKTFEYNSIYDIIDNKYFFPGPASVSVSANGDANLTINLSSGLSSAIETIVFRTVENHVTTSLAPVAKKTSQSNIIKVSNTIKDTSLTSTNKLKSVFNLLDVTFLDKYVEYADTNVRYEYTWSLKDKNDADGKPITSNIDYLFTMSSRFDEFKLKLNFADNNLVFDVKKYVLNEVNGNWELQKAEDILEDEKQYFLNQINKFNSFNNVLEYKVLNFEDYLAKVEEIINSINNKDLFAADLVAFYEQYSTIDAGSEFKDSMTAFSRDYIDRNNSLYQIDAGNDSASSKVVKLLSEFNELVASPFSIAQLAITDTKKASLVLVKEWLVIPDWENSIPFLSDYRIVSK
jgi:hypothetical protein